jgi:hypothetical protein
MKTKQVRLHLNAARPSPQVKTPDGEISLLLFSEAEGSIAGVDLTGKEADQLRARAKKLKTSLDQMLCEGVFQMLKAKKLHTVLGPCLRPAAAVQAINGKCEVAAKPVSTLQQRMNLSYLALTIDATVEWLLLMSKESENNGLQAVSDIIIAKLNSDFSNLNASLTAEVAS